MSYYKDIVSATLEKKEVISLLPTLDDWRTAEDPYSGDSTPIISLVLAWKSLEPFFLSKGYRMFNDTSFYDRMPHEPYRDDLQQEFEYPFASRAYTSDIYAHFGTSSTLIWPARDSQGRDVVLKVIADDVKRTELEILKYLNTDEMRSNPRNHTIPVIDFLTYDKFTFAIMPRWDHAILPDFATVHELMHFSQAILEAVDFIHKHRIFHGDIIPQNTSMNVVYYESPLLSRGLRKPGATRYALIDFGYSIQYPKDTPLESIVEERFYCFERKGVPDLGYPYKPFPIDVYITGTMLQTYVRHIENFVPALGPFFDVVTNESLNELPSAKQALDMFMEIYRDVPESILAQPVSTLFWQNGIVMTKYS